MQSTFIPTVPCLPSLSSHQQKWKSIWPTKGFSPRMFIRRGIKNNDFDEPLPLNNYISPEEKLEMAKCIAAMHGLEDGAIAHADVQMGQLFRGKDGMIKIVDYNRAEPLLYDAKNEKYCRWTNGRPGGGSVSVVLW